MTFDPTTNRAPMGLLTEEEKQILISAKHGWQRYYATEDEWREADQPLWFVMNVYRAKPAPVVKSVWVNVYPEDEFEDYGIYVSPARTDRKTTDAGAKSTRIGVARFDLIDGVLSVELEPLDGDQEGADESIGPAYSLCEPFPSAPIKVRFDTDGHEQEGQQ